MELCKYVFICHMFITETFTQPFPVAPPNICCSYLYVFELNELKFAAESVRHVGTWPVRVWWGLIPVGSRPGGVSSRWGPSGGVVSGGVSSRWGRAPITNAILAVLRPFFSPRCWRMLPGQSGPAALCSAPCCRGGRCLKERSLQRRRPCVVSIPDFVHC